MAARHYQWCGANAPLPMTYLLKHATVSGAFVTYKYQPRRYLYVRVFIKPVFRQTRHWQWRAYTKTSLTVARLLRATGSGALPNLNRLPNVRCPECGGRLLQLICHSIEDSGRIYHKSHAFYPCEKYESEPSVLLILIVVFNFD
jgi:hypothetical protein